KMWILILQAPHMGRGIGRNGRNTVENDIGLLKFLHDLVLVVIDGYATAIAPQISFGSQIIEPWRGFGRHQYQNGWDQCCDRAHFMDLYIMQFVNFPDNVAGDG